MVKPEQTIRVERVWLWDHDGGEWTFRGASKGGKFYNVIFPAPGLFEIACAVKSLWKRFHILKQRALSEIDYTERGFRDG